MRLKRRTQSAQKSPTLPPHPKPPSPSDLDIPFWTQLPRVSFYEDWYVQASQHFPGIVVDPERERISFNTAMFEEELMSYLQKMEEPEKPVS